MKNSLKKLTTLFLTIAMLATLPACDDAYEYSGDDDEDEQTERADRDEQTDKTDESADQPSDSNDETEDDTTDTTAPESGNDDPATDDSPMLEYDLTHNDTYKVVGIGTCTDAEIVIPATYEGKAVVEIDDEAFEDCAEMTKVTIPDSVKRIGENAFSGCESLTEITIPDGVTEIGEYAFSRCCALTDVTISASVTSIGKFAFASCESVERITVAEGNSVYHSDGNCLIETASKTLIQGCRTSVIPQDGSVTAIGEAAFFGHDVQLTEITIPDGVTSIGQWAFYSCSALEKVTIPNSVTTIGEEAFAGTSLKTLTIPEGVTSIGRGAFSFTHITEVMIPASVTSIGGPLFIGSIDLTGITVAEGNSVYHSDGNCLIETASKTLIEGCSASVIPQDGSVTLIGDSAFYSVEHLTEVTIPNGVTSISDHAFYGCYELVSVTIPDSVTSIDKSAFSACRSLAEITIPAGVTLVGKNAFTGCNALKSVVFVNLDGWTVDGESIDLSDPAQAALDLTETYRFSELTRS